MNKYSKINKNINKLFGDIILILEATMKKDEVKCIDDIKKLKKEEQAKWEMAVELGLFDKVVENGWKSLTARESGRIGGMLSAKSKEK